MLHRMYKPAENKKNLPIPNCFVKEIVSGGQTGVDRAALDLAIELKIPHSGWCPKGRKAEHKEAIPEKYQLKETPTDAYEERTEWNARDSGGTLVIVKDAPMGGTLFTIEMAEKHNRPCYVLELTKESNLDKVAEWILTHRIQKLNVAGPRASQTEGIYGMAYNALNDLLKHDLLTKHQLKATL